MYFRLVCCCVSELVKAFYIVLLNLLLQQISYNLSLSMTTDRTPSTINKLKKARELEEECRRIRALAKAKADTISEVDLKKCSG
jgi:hypothetical protein